MPGFLEVKDASGGTVYLEVAEEDFVTQTIEPSQTAPGGPESPVAGLPPGEAEISFFRRSPKKVVETTVERFDSAMDAAIGMCVDTFLGAALGLRHPPTDAE